MCDPMTWFPEPESIHDAEHEHLRSLIGAHPLPHDPDPWASDPDRTTRRGDTTPYPYFPHRTR